jgi:thioredoxin reductase (NADPH)
MPVAKVEPKLKAMIKEGKKPFELIIIGGGPAGLAAGIYAKRYKLDAILIESALPGGLITTTELIENYPGFPEGISGTELGKRFEEQAMNNGLEIIFGKVVNITKRGGEFEVVTEDAPYTCRSVIIASGSAPKKLGVPGEEKFAGKGVSYCATCDGPFYKGKNVAVVGGGNAAIEEAMFLTKYAKLVTVIHRRGKLRADEALQEKAKANPKIFFKLEAIVEEITGDKNVSSIKIKDTQTDKKSSLNVDGVFIYVGHKPNTDFAKDIIKLNDDGTVITDVNLATNISGIFAAGDVRKKDFWQVVTSVADGALAAHSVKDYLEKSS